LTGKQKIHVFVTAQTAIYHCTIASYHCTFCVSLHTILCPEQQNIALSIASHAARAKRIVGRRLLRSLQSSAYG